MEATTTATSAETMVVPVGGEFEVVAVVNGAPVHIAFAMDRARAESIAAQVFAINAGGR